jgi:hypothetical protein
MRAFGWWHGTPHEGAAEEVESKGKLRLFTDQGGGWRDMIGTPAARTTGAGIPNWTQIGATGFWAYKFAVGDKLQFVYHLQHDMNPDAPGMYLHTHWITSGGDVHAVKWQIQWTFARGFNQSAFAFGAPSTDTAEEAPPTTAYQHMTTEIAAPINPGDFQVDGLLIVNVSRITNGGVDNGANVFLLTADVHYQADTVNTRQRTPPFY